MNFRLDAGFSPSSFLILTELIGIRSSPDSTSRVRFGNILLNDSLFSGMVGPSWSTVLSLLLYGKTQIFKQSLHLLEFSENLVVSSWKKTLGGVFFEDCFKFLRTQTRYFIAVYFALNLETSFLWTMNNNFDLLFYGGHHVYVK